MIYRHNKSGGLYVFICEGKMEADNTQRMAVYKSLQDGEVWIRPIEEFEQADRFAKLNPSEYATTQARVFVQGMMFGRDATWNDGKKAIANMIVNALNFEPK